LFILIIILEHKAGVKVINNERERTKWASSSSSTTRVDEQEEKEKEQRVTMASKYSPPLNSKFSLQTLKSSGEKNVFEKQLNLVIIAFVHNKR